MNDIDGFVTLRRRKLVRWLWGGYSLLLLAGSLVPGESVPEVALLGWDKLAHAVAFVVLAGLTVFVVIRSRRRSWLVLGYGATMGVATELLQSFVPGRTASGWDWLADVVGTALCLLLVGLWLRRKMRGEEKPAPVMPKERKELVPES